VKIELLYHGQLWRGSTSLQRLEAFALLPHVSVIYSDSGYHAGEVENLYRRIRWKLRWPVDVKHENRMLLERVMEYRPDIVIIDNSKVIKRSTLEEIRKICSCRLVYYTPDDIMGKHNLSYQIKRSFPDWDVFFTTKTFNVKELLLAGVKRPILVGKAYDPILHSPMTPDEVGEEFEVFDCVFIGTYEKERHRTINALAASGLTVVVYGSDKGNWAGKKLHHRVTLRPSVYAQEYRRCFHHGKIALCFLRKINRDRITQRTMEIAAMARPMFAEKTEEHDEHFIDGKEYIGFKNDKEAVRLCKSWLKHDTELTEIGLSARVRCLRSEYSSADRAKFMIDEIMVSE
jgi:spore maturation protein CgeB